MNDQLNPYVAPTVEDEFVPAAAELVDAGRGRRFLNLIIDFIFLQAVDFVVFAVATVLGAELGTGGPKVYAIGFANALAYYCFFEGVFGRTPAKLITGTRVVHEDGHKLRFRQILGRTFARFLPFEPFSFFAEKQGWHDRLSGTRVIRTRR